MKQLIKKKPLKRRGIDTLSCINPTVAISDSVEYQKVALGAIFARVSDSTTNIVCKSCNGTGYMK